MSRVPDIFVSLVSFAGAAWLVLSEPALSVNMWLGLCLMLVAGVLFVDSVGADR